MDHRALIAALPDATRARLVARSDAAGLCHLAAHFGTLGLSTAGIAAQVPLWPLLIPVQGILLNFLFTLSHECTHQTPFRSRWINEAVGQLVALLIVLPFTWFRYFHLAHHRYTNDPGRDPELADRPRPENRAELIIYLTGWRYWAGMLRTLAGTACGRSAADYLPAGRHRRMRREARILICLYVLALSTLWYSPLLIWAWGLPLLVGQPFLRLYLLAEHGLCPPVASMLENSRTTFTNRLVRALAWNMPYHAEHHAFPNVPFHRLPELHRWTRAHLKSTSPGYVRFSREYLKALER